MNFSNVEAGIVGLRVTIFYDAEWNFERGLTENIPNIKSPEKNWNHDHSKWKVSRYVGSGLFFTFRTIFAGDVFNQTFLEITFRVI